MRGSIDPKTNKRQLNQWLEGLSPLSIIKWAIDTYSPKLVATSSFGLNGVTLIHLLQKVSSEIPIIFVNTGYMFEETLKTKRQIEAAYGIKVFTFRPYLSIRDQVQKFGPSLFIHHPDLCCNLRKVEPMKRAFAEFRPNVVINSRARFQGQTRQNLPIAEWEKKPIHINPLASWPQEKIESYIKNNSVPYNPLYDIGYLSIGCRPCTRRILKGEHIRAGRWTDSEKAECGLWAKSLLQEEACKAVP